MQYQQSFFDDEDMLVSDCINVLYEQHQRLTLTRGYSFLRFSDTTIRNRGKEKRNELINEYF